MQTKQLLALWMVCWMEPTECHWPTGRLAAAPASCDNVKTAGNLLPWIICIWQHGQKNRIFSREMATFSGCSIRQELKRLFYLYFRLNAIQVFCWQGMEGLDSWCVQIIKQHPALKRGSSILLLHRVNNHCRLFFLLALPTLFSLQITSLISLIIKMDCMFWSYKINLIFTLETKGDKSWPLKRHTETEHQLTHTCAVNWNTSLIYAKKQAVH